jgi:hypothetical protein
MTPACPNCTKRSTARLAGESDGGWWFVCLVCDFMWDQRQCIGRTGDAAIVGHSVQRSSRMRTRILATAGVGAAVLAWWKTLGAS